MRILITILVAVCTVLPSFAQLVQKEDGLYYNSSGNLYSGTYVEYFDNGNIRLEMNVEEGKKNGISTYYFMDNTKQEVRYYVDNKMDGVWETWNEQGVKIGIASYKNGVKEGNWKIFDEDGTLRYDMNYKDGEKSGTWKIFNEKGKLSATKNY